MFENRHLTCGVQATIPPEIISFMWCLIDDLIKDGYAVNSLQIFEFWEESDGMVKSVQMVRHTQDPDYRAIYNICLPIIKPINAKIFVIDDISHSTMLLAQEY